MISFDKSTELIYEISENKREDITDECLLAVSKHLDFFKKRIQILLLMEQKKENKFLFYMKTKLYITKKYINKLRDKIRYFNTLIKYDSLCRKDN